MAATRIYKNGDIVHYTQKKGKHHVYKTGTFDRYERFSSGQTVLLMKKEPNTGITSPYVGGDLVYPSEVDKVPVKHVRRKFTI